MASSRFVFPWPLSPMMTTPSAGKSSAPSVTLRKSRSARCCRSAMTRRTDGDRARAGLAPRERRRALLEYGRLLLLHVVGGREETDVVRLEHHPFLERHLQSA